MIINFRKYSDTKKLLISLNDKVESEGIGSLNRGERTMYDRLSYGVEVDLNDYKPKKIPKKRKSHRSNNTIKGFKPGDEIYLNYNHDDIKEKIEKLPKYVLDYLKSKDKYEIERFNGDDKIDIGCNRTVDGKRKVFYFPTEYFSLTVTTLQSR